MSGLVVQVNVKEGRIEKWIMRKAFDDEENPYLPKVMAFPLEGTLRDIVAPNLELVLLSFLMFFDRKL